MALFRNISHFPKIRKGMCLGLTSKSSISYNDLASIPKRSNFSSAFPVGRHQSSISQLNYFSIENTMALHPLRLKTLINPSSASSFITQNFSRKFHRSSKCQQNQDPNSKSPSFGEQMSLRLMNENGFLSWTRNSYLSAAVGATMLNGANADVVQHAGILVLFVSAMNMAWGTACHFTNLIRIRNRCAMSRPILLLNLLGCVFHALLWLLILGYYIHFSGYTGWVRHRRRQSKEIDHPMPNKEE